MVIYCIQFPLVFINGKCIGGASDTLQKDTAGELKNMLVRMADKGVQVDADSDAGSRYLYVCCFRIFKYYFDLLIIIM